MGVRTSSLHGVTSSVEDCHAAHEMGEGEKYAKYALVALGPCCGIGVGCKVGCGHIAPAPPQNSRKTPL